MSLSGGALNLMQIETRWTMLPPPPGPEHPDWEESWRYLFLTYAPAMRRYVGALLRGMFKQRPDDAEVEDVVQDYLSHCIDKGWLSRDAGSIRSFRSYLKTQVFRFTCDYLDRKYAQKRSAPGTRDERMLQGVGTRADDPAIRAFDEGLVDVAREEAIRKLGEANADQAEVIRDLLRTAGEGSTDLAERLGRPAKQLPVLKHRARKAFATLFAEELKGTVVDLEAFGELLKALEPHLP
jgi:DNA-directed RNA polymerase specialized sigma24 family protein